MMSLQICEVDLGFLRPEFLEKTKAVLQKCKQRGVDLRVYTTVRGPLLQAKLWRQSRTIEEINRTVKRFRQEGAEYLATLIEDAGPCYGRWATNNPPGLSWHQWQEAVDAYVVSDTTRAIWTPLNPGYAVYAEEAKKLDLTACYYWEHRDAVQVQYRSQQVVDIYSLAEIDREMRKRFA